MSASDALNANASRFDACKHLQHVSSPQLPPQYSLPCLIGPVHLQDALRDIEPNHFDNHLHGASLAAVRLDPPLLFSDAL